MTKMYRTAKGCADPTHVANVPMPEGCDRAWVQNPRRLPESLGSLAAISRLDGDQVLTAVKQNRSVYPSRRI